MHTRCVILGHIATNREREIKVILTFYCPYLNSYPIGIPLFETRLTSPLGLQRVNEYMLALAVSLSELIYSSR